MEIGSGVWLLKGARTRRAQIGCFRVDVATFAVKSGVEYRATEVQQVLARLRWFKNEEDLLISLPTGLKKEKTEKFDVDARGSASDGTHESDAMIVSLLHSLRVYCGICLSSVGRPGLAGRLWCWGVRGRLLSPPVHPGCSLSTLSTAFLFLRCGLSFKSSPKVLHGNEAIWDLTMRSITNVANGADTRHARGGDICDIRM